MLETLHKPHRYPQIIYLADHKTKVVYDNLQEDHEAYMIVYELISGGINLQDFMDRYLNYFEVMQHKELIIRIIFAELMESKR